MQINNEDINEFDIVTKITATIMIFLIWYGVGIEKLIPNLQ